MPTMPSPTRSRMSAAGTKAHSSIAAGASNTPGAAAGGSAVKSCSGRLRLPSGLMPHSATSFHNAADNSRTSTSVQGTAASTPLGRIAAILPRHVLAHGEARGPSSSSHMLPRSRLISFCDQMRVRSFSCSSRHIPISGNCIITACQLPRTQSLCLFASAIVQRFSAQRNCARSRFLAQSYAVRSCGPANMSRSRGWSYHSERRSCAWHCPQMGDEVKAATPRFRASTGTSPSPESARTAKSTRVASANSAPCGRSNISGDVWPPMVAASARTMVRCSCSPARNSSAASVKRLNASWASGTSGFLSGCSALESCL
mmetsp:Transcript_107501/g.310717  ORF Transcript_107501/g.310717 Transcript_107501/m.310717 type:complete len:315 (-) Transcript_107501:225-1169(-)